MKTRVSNIVIGALVGSGLLGLCLFAFGPNALAGVFACFTLSALVERDHRWVWERKVDDVFSFCGCWFLRA